MSYAEILAHAQIKSKPSLDQSQSQPRLDKWWRGKFQSIMYMFHQKATDPEANTALQAMHVERSTYYFISNNFKQSAA